MKALLFSLILLVSMGCKPSKVNIDTVETSPPVVEEEQPESEIHGGSPAPADWETCGPVIGDHACDLVLIDQFDDTFQLYDNYDKIILLDFSAMWCGPCNMAAAEVESFMLDYSDQGFLWVTVLIDNPVGDPPTSDDISDWADTYSIETSPILAADRSLIDLTGEDGWPIGAWPTFVILDRDLVVKNGIYGWSDNIMRQWIESEL